MLLTSSGDATSFPVTGLYLTAGSQGVVVLDRYEHHAVPLNLGVRVASASSSLSLRVDRPSYQEPIRLNGRVSSLRDFTGIPGFITIAVSDEHGARVGNFTQTFCPNSQATPNSAQSTRTSPFPLTCSTNPFVRHTVWGIQADWSAAAFDPFARPVELTPGNYIARISIAKTYRDLFSIPPSQASVTVQFQVKDTDQAMPEPVLDGQASPPLVPNQKPPNISFPEKSLPKPDLQPLPAGAMSISRAAGHDFLSFFSTVANAGPAVLQVDGFRRPGVATMDAYQYFVDAEGRTQGAAKVGSLSWDPRDGHHHWHLADFASYQLLDASKTTVARSGKQGFCLTSTDLIDLSLPYAIWQPSSVPLHTACAGHQPDATSLREQLDVGSGDTYQQSLPGQSFDITTLPNGDYYVRVIANPTGNLYETNYHNNISTRGIILGGRPGARTVVSLDV
jgi:hypothetical protein